MKKSLLLIVFTLPLTAEIRILFSAALVDAHFALRKQQYLESFAQLAKYGYGYEDIYVVEAIKKKGPTFLEQYAQQVFYASVNNPRYKNNGINEARTILEGCYYFNFSPEDMIIKVTGRHHFISDHFLQMVKNNMDCDAIVKMNESGDVWTLAFAMKYKHLKNMLEHIDYTAMERRWINLETEVARYIQRKTKEGNFNVLYADRLDIKATFDGSSTSPGATGCAFY
jgi:hypothetical protein